MLKHARLQQETIKSKIIGVVATGSLMQVNIDSGPLRKIITHIVIASFQRCLSSLEFAKCNPARVIARGSTAGIGYHYYLYP